MDEKPVSRTIFDVLNKGAERYDALAAAMPDDGNRSHFKLRAEISRQIATALFYGSITDEEFAEQVKSILSKITDLKK